MLMMLRNIVVKNNFNNMGVYLEGYVYIRLS